MILRPLRALFSLVANNSFRNLRRVSAKFPGGRSLTPWDNVEPQPSKILGLSASLSVQWDWVKTEGALNIFRTSTSSQDDADDPNSYGSYTFQRPFIPPISFGLHSSNLSAAILGGWGGAERSFLLSGGLSQCLPVALWSPHE